MTIPLRILVAVLLCVLACSARAADDFYERPPLRWADIEEPLRMFCDVDEGPAWTQAWPNIERAYLDFLAEEDLRRTVDAKPLAELYGPIESGVADERAVREYARRWSAHIERCAAAEDALLQAIVAFVPDAARAGASALPRGRMIERLTKESITNAPVMALALRRVLVAELSPDARSQAREAIHSAEESMVGQLRSLQKGAREYHAAMERQHSKTSAELRAGEAADTAAMAAAVAEAQASAERAISAAGQAHAAVERIGVDALIGLVERWSLEDRVAALSTLGDHGTFASVKARVSWKDRRIEWALRHFPHDAAADAAIAEARTNWTRGACELVVTQLRELADDAVLVGDHIRDLHAARPSRWLTAMNEHAEARELATRQADTTFDQAVRTALAIPADHRWPRLRAEDFKEVAPSTDANADAAAKAAEELNQYARGLDGFGGSAGLWSHPAPDAAGVAALAARLDVDAEAAKAWQSGLEGATHDSVASIATLDGALRDALRQGSEGRDAVTAAWRALWDASTANARTGVDAIRTAVASAPLPAAECVASFDVWSSRTRTADARAVMLRSVHTIGANAAAAAEATPLPWLDRGGNPLEALDGLALAPAQRRAVDAAIRDDAVRFADAAEALDEAELLASLDIELALEGYQRFFRNGATLEERMKGWIELDAQRTAIVERTREPAIRRVAAAKALREHVGTAIGEARRGEFERSLTFSLLPGIDQERPRFARPFATAVAKVAGDPPRRAAVEDALRAWEALWETRTQAMATLDDGAAFRSLARRANLSARERHGAAVLRWCELRRREESLVAMRELSRLVR